VLLNFFIGLRAYVTIVSKTTQNTYTLNTFHIKSGMCSTKTPNLCSTKTPNLCSTKTPNFVFQKRRKILKNAYLIRMIVAVRFKYVVCKAGCTLVYPKY
jgi:hypothetical protein